MDIDEAEGERGGGDDRIERLRRAAVEGDHPVDQEGQVLRPRADMVRQRHPGLAVVLADEAPVRAEAELGKARGAEDYALETQQFVAVERLPAGLADGAAPPLNTVV